MIQGAERIYNNIENIYFVKGPGTVEVAVISAPWKMNEKTDQGIHILSRRQKMRGILYIYE